MQRIHGTISAEAAAKLKQINETATDWYAVCPKCHTELTGTLAELKAHRCEPVASP